MNPLDQQLIEACQNGVDLTVKQLLHQGANPNTQDRRGRTPLMIATRNGDIHILQLLIQHGANPNTTDEDGQTALHYAFVSQNPTVAQYLITQLQADLNIQDRWGRTPFLLATQNGDISMLQRLIQLGANPHIKNTSGKSALHFALEERHPAIVQYLLTQLHLDPNTPDHEGTTPLMIATEKGDINMLQLLIQHGANPHATDHKGQTALHYAACYGHDKAVQYLIIQLHLDPNTQDHQGNTPLHIAFQVGYAYIARTLIRLGANPHIPNHQGQTLAAAIARRRQIRLPKPQPSTITL